MEKKFSAKVGRMAYQFLIRSLTVLVAVEGTIGLALATTGKAQAVDPIPEVIINELQWMGSSVSAEDEWVELYNSSSSVPIDIQGWTLTGLAGGADLTLPKGSPLTVAPSSYYLISRFLDTSPSSASNVVPDFQTVSLAIPDSCPAGGVKLLDDLAATVDSVTCSSTAWPAGTDLPTVKAAMERSWPITNTPTWQTAQGSFNLDATTLTHTYATPRFTNDEPQGGLVRDGVDADVNWSASLTEAMANWSDFTDLASGLSGNYLVGLGSKPGLSDVRAFTTVAGNTYTFVGLSLSEDQTYYASVIAINTLGVTGSPVSSDGFTINTVAPQPPTSLTVVDAPADNGGALLASWKPSPSIDGITYQLNYRQLGSVAWTIVVGGEKPSFTLTGLQNTPATYEVTVEAIDFNNLHSTTTAIATGQAVDNLAPIVDSSKVIFSQNQPGTNDTIAGMSGASSEGNVMVRILDQDPAVSPGFVVINSVMSLGDGSFPAMSIGDNQYPKVWIQMTDAAGNVGTAQPFNNDIVAPNAPRLTRLSAHCLTRCAVNIDWQDQGPDSHSFQVGYAKTDPETRTMAVAVPAISLDLASGDGYVFGVYAIDAAGNTSLKSNLFSVQLTRGVETIVELIDGQAVTTTKAILGSAAVVTNTSAGNSLQSAFVPAAQAQEPTETATPTNTPTPNPVSSQSRSDWTRISVAALILLIVAGSFYALSRNFRQPTPVKETKEKSKSSNSPPITKDSRQTQPKKTNKNRSRRRR